MRILIVEDERRLANIIKKGLTEDGFAVDVAYDGAEGKYMAELNAKEYDAIVLDLNLPKIDGLTLCKSLREQKIEVPILILTAMDSIEDKVRGLDLGADDYMAKPFAFAELRSRLNAIVRRHQADTSPILEVADLTLDPAKHEVRRNGKLVKLSPKEFGILDFLMRNHDTVVSRTKLIKHVWDYNFDSLSNVVDVFVATVRKKIDKESKKKLIHTIHGVGYKLSEEE
ncbi:MAG: response regulator transcription factor [bacterium]